MAFVDLERRPDNRNLLRWSVDATKSMGRAAVLGVGSTLDWAADTFGVHTLSQHGESTVEMRARVQERDRKATKEVASQEGFEDGQTGGVDWAQGEGDGEVVLAPPQAPNPGVRQQEH